LVIDSSEFGRMSCRFLITHVRYLWPISPSLYFFFTYARLRRIPWDLRHDLTQRSMVLSHKCPKLVPGSETIHQYLQQSLRRVEIFKRRTISFSIVTLAFFKFQVYFRVWIPTLIDSMSFIFLDTQNPRLGFDDFTSRDCSNVRRVCWMEHSWRIGEGRCRHFLMSYRLSDDWSCTLCPWPARIVRLSLVSVLEGWIVDIHAR
jgi:hypothetical protein